MRPRGSFVVAAAAVRAAATTPPSLGEEDPSGAAGAPPDAGRPSASGGSKGGKTGSGRFRAAASGAAPVGLGVVARGSPWVDTVVWVCRLHRPVAHSVCQRQKIRTFALVPRFNAQLH